MKKQYFTAAVIVILGLLFFFAPSHIAHVCNAKPDGSFMKCHWMGEAVRMIGFLVILTGVLFALLRKYAKGLALSCVLLAGAQVCLQFFVGWSIGSVGLVKDLDTGIYYYVAQDTSAQKESKYFHFTSEDLKSEK